MEGEKKWGLRARETAYRGENPFTSNFAARKGPSPRRGSLEVLTIMEEKGA